MCVIDSAGALVGSVGVRWSIDSARVSLVSSFSQPEDWVRRPATLTPPAKQLLATSAALPAPLHGPAPEPKIYDNGKTSFCSASRYIDTKCLCSSNSNPSWRWHICVCRRRRGRSGSTLRCQLPRKFQHPHVPWGSIEIDTENAAEAVQHCQRRRLFNGFSKDESSDTTKPERFHWRLGFWRDSTCAPAARGQHRRTIAPAAGPSELLCYRGKQAVCCQFSHLRQ